MARFPKPHPDICSPIMLQNYNEISPTKSGPDEDESDEDEIDNSVRSRFEEIKKFVNRETKPLSDDAQRDELLAKYGLYLWQQTDDDEKKTLLHYIIEDTKGKSQFERYKPLVQLLLSEETYLAKLDSNKRTGLYIAVSKKCRHLVQFILNHYKHQGDFSIDKIIAMPSIDKSNCLHVVMKHSKPPAEMIQALINKAGKEAFVGRDNEGRTPLHIAVEYKRCAKGRFETVSNLIQRCDTALDIETDGKLSPYRHHEKTRTAHTLTASAPNNPRHQAKESVADDRKRADGMPSQMRAPGPPRPAVPKFDGESNDPFDKALRPLKRDPEHYVVPGVRFEERPDIMTQRTPSRGPTRLRRTATSDMLDQQSRRTKDDPIWDESTANSIRDHLKLHYMRNRNDERTIKFLYGRGQAKEIYLNLFEHTSDGIRYDRLKANLDHLKFENVLRCVALPSLSFEGGLVNEEQAKARAICKGRDDAGLIFSYLRDREVDRILRVIVNDLTHPSHSDEAIETAMSGFEVEIWDWRKFDLCVDTIRSAAPDVREVCLYWSGNNAVLRSWSGPMGLVLLTELQKVTLYYDVDAGLETRERNRKKVADFKAEIEKQIKDSPRELQITIEDGALDGVLSRAAGNPVIEPGRAEIAHKWLDPMDQFASFIQNVPPPAERVTVAVIDDGIDLNEPSLYRKIMGGRSFMPNPADENMEMPYYGSSGGHGTVMASLVCRLCPLAQLYILRLKTSHTRQITAESAAKAIQAAVDQKVNIISMSWTIEKTKDNSDDIKELETAIEAAYRAGILMFCAASDQGPERDKSYPAACGGTKNIFKIGAAEASGKALNMVGDPAHIDFFFPGEYVSVHRHSINAMRAFTPGLLTGSSIATAIASGMAALVLYCVQIAASPQSGQANGAVTMKDFQAAKEHSKMKDALLSACTSPQTPRFMEVSSLFGKAAKRAEEELDSSKRVEIVGHVAAYLVNNTKPPWLQYKGF